jgi:DNA-binding transcriptional ArsR family regulator
MSPTTPDITPRALRKNAPIFAALGDPTRLALISKLSAGSRFSISTLTEDTSLTRQAITKHLRVLEQAGLVHSLRQGRESLFELKPEPLDEARHALDRISKQWDNALARLKSFVEK